MLTLSGEEREWTIAALEFLAQATHYAAQLSPYGESRKAGFDRARRIEVLITRIRKDT